jgi:PhnB protein
MEIPENHQAIMPYLILNNGSAFLEFVEVVFKAVPGMKRMREERPEMIMHAEVAIQESTIMFADAGNRFPVANANLFVYVDDADATYHLALEHGSTTVMDLSNQDYGRTCGVLDPFGNTWWITSPI